jgi:hypothetical protein
MSFLSDIGTAVKNLFTKVEDSSAVKSAVTDVENAQLSNINVYVLVAIAVGLLWLTKGVLSELHQNLIFDAAIVYMIINGLTHITAIIGKSWVKATEAKYGDVVESDAPAAPTATSAPTAGPLK